MRPLSPLPNPLRGRADGKDFHARCLAVHDELRICHRDVKLDNLLLDADGRVVVGDFGCAEALDAEGRVKHTKVNRQEPTRGSSAVRIFAAADLQPRLCGAQGTYTFMAPECLRVLEKSQVYTGHDGRAADVWALGVSAFVSLQPSKRLFRLSTIRWGLRQRPGRLARRCVEERRRLLLSAFCQVLIFGVPPFNSQSLEGLFNCICSQELSLPADVEVSEEFGDFLRRVLQKDSTERLTIKQVLVRNAAQTANSSSSPDSAFVHYSLRIEFFYRAMSNACDAEPPLGVVCGLLGICSVREETS